MKNLRMTLLGAMAALAMVGCSGEPVKTVETPQRATSAPVAAKADGIAWAPDFPSAMALANQENKLVLIKFWADWCTICKELEKDMNEDREYRSMFANVVPVMVDTEAEANKSVVAKYHNDQLPSLVLVDPKTGEMKQRLVGYSKKDATKFKADLRKMLGAPLAKA